MFCFCYGLEESEESELIQWMFSDPSLRKTLLKSVFNQWIFLLYRSTFDILVNVH